MSRKVRRNHPLWHVVLLTTVACGCAAEDDTSPDPEGSGGNAGASSDGAVPSSPIDRAYDALVRADYDALPEVIAALDEAVASDPEDGRSAFYAGAMRLWRLGERQRSPDYAPADLAVDSLGPLGAVESLDRARALLPEDARPAAFYGIAQIAVGTVIADEARIDEGRQALSDAVSLYPSYVHGVEAIMLGTLPRDHQYFPDAIDAFSATVEACGFSADDIAALTLPYPTGVLPRERWACNNDGIVAHVWEGIFLTFGDNMVKQGDAEQGRALYENAKRSPTYDRWLLQDVLDRRIEDADTRAALYLDDDPANDPPTWIDEGRVCVGCHASRP